MRLLSSALMLAVVCGGQGEKAGVDADLERARKAVSICERMRGKNHPDVAVPLGNLAGRLGDRSKHREAEPLWRRALALHENTPRQDRQFTAILLRGLADSLRHNGKYQEAADTYRLALAMKQKTRPADHVDIARCLNDYALTLERLGKYADAEQLYRRALQLFRQAKEHEKLDTAVALNNLAGILRHQGKYADAEQLYKESLRIRQEVLPPEHPAIAVVFNNLGLIHVARGNLGEAERFHRLALAQWEKALSPDHPTVAYGLNNLGVVLTHLGQLEEANARLRRALAIRRECLGPEHPNIADALGNLGAVRQNQGRFEAAKQLYDRALAMLERTLGPDHPSTGICLGCLSSLHLEGGDFVDAWRLMRTRFERGRNHLQQLFRLISEEQRFCYIERQRASLDILLGIATSSISKLSRNDLDTSYETLLEWKGRVYRSMAWLRAKLALDDAQREKLDELRRVQARLSNVLARVPVQDPQLYRRQSQDLLRRHGEMEAEIAKGLADRQPKETASLRGLRDGLPKDSVLLDFYIRDAFDVDSGESGPTKYRGVWRDRRCSAWIVRPAERHVAHVDLGPAAELGALVLRHLKGVAQDSESHEKAAADLFARLWKPLASAVGGAKLVFVSPDGFLGKLPFETLRGDGDKYLIERFRFVYLPEPLAITSNRGPTGLPKSVLAVGGVDYERRKAAALAADAVAGGLRSGLPERWPPLAATAEEARRVCETLQRTAGAKSLLLTGTAATEERLKTELPLHEALHVATHGFFEPDRLPSLREGARQIARTGSEPSWFAPARTITGYLPGLLAGLVCAGANEPAAKGQDDGLLTAEEVAWLDLSRCRLVVLSACETGLGRTKGGQGMLSLRRAFHQAGARTVISSLWKVQDDATRTLMADFYDRLWRQRQRPIDALHGARLALLADNRARYRGRGRPETWGAFVLSGSWR